jgi:hypothetical protein
MIITLSGKAEAGKDMCADIMREALVASGRTVLIIHHADYLKYICKTYFGWDGVKDERGRSILQEVGTDLVRAKYPNYWVEATMRTVLILEHLYDFFLIPDCRFPNEIDSPRNVGFDITSVLVVRTDHVNSLTEKQRMHPSETALDNYEFDYTVSSITGRNNLWLPTIDVLSKITGYHWGGLVTDDSFARL